MVTNNSKPLHIVFVTNSYFPYSGGVVSSIVTARAALQAEGHRVTIITLDFVGTEGEIEPGVFSVVCPIRFMYKKNVMAIPWRPTHQIKKMILLLKPDIIHVHHPFLLGKSALRVAYANRIPCLFTYHTTYEDCVHYLPFPQLITRFVTTHVVNRYCQKVNAIIAPSGAVKNHIEQQQISTVVKVIPSSIDTRFLLKSARIINQSIDIPFNLLCVSRFSKEKNVYVLLDVFARVVERSQERCYALTLIGYGHEYEGLQKYAYEKYGFSKEQVRFIHKPEKEVIVHWYRTVDLFLFPSLSDTQGLVLAEAMGGGTPVIALDGPGQRAIIKQGENGFIVYSLDEMVATIIKIAQDAQLHQLLSIGAWSTAQQYAPVHMARQLVAVYRGLCAHV